MIAFINLNLNGSAKLNINLLNSIIQALFIKHNVNHL